MFAPKTKLAADEVGPSVAAKLRSASCWPERVVPRAVAEVSVVRRLARAPRALPDPLPRVPAAALQRHPEQRPTTPPPTVPRPRSAQLRAAGGWKAGRYGPRPGQQSRCRASSAARVPGRLPRGRGSRGRGRDTDPAEALRKDAGLGQRPGRTGQPCPSGLCEPPLPCWPRAPSSLAPSPVSSPPAALLGHHSGLSSERIGAEPVVPRRASQAAQLDEHPYPADDRQQRDEQVPAGPVAVVEALHGHGE